MAILHVQSKVCIAPFHVWSKFAPQMERSNADFARHIERTHSITNQKNFEILKFLLFKFLYICILAWSQKR